ncbi:MAG: DUF927 domain-containing protein [Anaerocolumna aminovalerica]|uniref:DUF927 domain-containing protein n=1 Tax=Anaerocolumna aminovalerica TaxID=1527 RepID=UPI0029116901|nr:DUF927 domain-containing protein [Anaerocolumna aminovalerica]MDU6265818.1 DUF927 domain-containing protein [Anaerocolumna aminovalerica]
MGAKKNPVVDKKEAAIELAEINRQLEEIDNMTDFIDSPLQLWCGKWKCDETGVYKLLPSKNNPELLVRVEASYQQIMPSGIIENIETGEHRYIISFSIKKRNSYIWKSIKIEPIICSTKGKIVALSNLGIVVNDNNAKQLVSYISDMLRLNQDMIPTHKAISHLGWIGNTFFPYVSNIIFDGDCEQEKIVEAITQKGNYDTWKEECTKYRKNMAVRLIMDASFASVLIEKIGGLCFVFHLWGGSGTGKTVSLIVASSIWGEPDKLYISADATQNFITNRATFMRNIPLFIDETQINKVAVEKLIYSITEGKPRGRLGRDSREKGNKDWLNTSILTGESPVVNIGSGAGAINRVLEIELDGPLFEDFTETLSIVRNNYGYAGKEFVEYIQNSNISNLKDRYQKVCKMLEKYDSTGKQVQNLAFIILADQIAGECIFKDEKALDIKNIATFLKTKNEVSVAERAYQRTIDWIAANPIKFDNNNAYEVWGKRDKNHVFVNKSILSDFLSSNNFDFDSVKREWAEKGFLEKDNCGQFTTLVRVGESRIRCPKIKLPDNQNEKGNESEETDFKQLSTDDIVPFVTDE